MTSAIVRGVKSQVKAIGGETGLQRIRWLRDATKALRQDTLNVLSYGASAPLFAERVWVDLASIKKRVNLPGTASGVVRGGDWDLNAVALTEDEWEIAACRARWFDGCSWDQTGIFDRFAETLAVRGYKDGCRTIDDVRERYKRLDILFLKVKTAREFPLRTDPWYFREADGILVHVDRSGAPIFGRRGCHRFAIARLLEIEHIPCKLGVVHADAVKNWRNALVQKPHP